MRNLSLYLAMMLLLVLSATGCSDDFDTPPMVVPVATSTPNTTIADFKAKYWQDAVNYIDTVKDDIVIHGRVVSSDASGNIYKSLYIADETGGLAISINGTSLYNTYRIGQDIVIPLKDMWVGKYNGQQQLGYPQYYSSGGVWEATFLPLAMWEQAAQLNGMPNPSAVDTVKLNISELGSDAATQRKWQGQLVRIDNVKFEDADGTNTYATSDATTNRTITDQDGNTLVVRNSNYATFRAAVLPMGRGSVVGVLGYYSTRNNQAGTWQLYLRSSDDCIGFSTTTKGLSTDPYTVSEAIENQNNDISGWMTGYVVGAVAPEVTEVKSNSDVEWTAPTTLNTTLVIGPTPETNDIKQCVVVALPQNTPFRNQANLVDFPEVYKTQIWVKGTFATYMGTYGITGNSGSSDEFMLSITTGGVTELDEGFENGLPSTWLNVQVKGDKNWYTTTYNSNTYAAMTGYKGNQPPFDAWLITPALDIKKATNRILTFRTQVNGYSSTTSHFEVYVMTTSNPSTATLVKLSPTIATAPSSGYSDWQESGNIDLSDWADGTYFIGFRYEAQTDANYATWCLDDVKFGQGGSSSTSSGTSGDFSTFNSGNPTGTYGTYTSTAGWTATNASILKGGAADANPVFTFIGYATGSTTEYATAVNLNGKTSSVGTLVSPTLTGGIGTLSFNYGVAYTESNGASFRVDIKQNGTVAKTFTITKSDAVKYTAYTETLDVDLTGDFTIEFVNLSPSGLDSNKDRVAIWNVNWTNSVSSVRKR